MACNRYSPFLYDGIAFSKPGWRLGDKNCRRIHPRVPELNRLFRETDFRVVDEGNSVVLIVDIPGIRGKDLLVRINAGVLRIEGRRVLKSGESEKKFKFSKNFLVDDSLDTTHLKAMLEAGVLTIKIKRKEISQPYNEQVAATSVDGVPESKPVLKLELMVHDVKPAPMSQFSTWVEE